MTYRLEALVNNSGLKPARFCKMTGLPRVSYYNIRKDERAYTVSISRYIHSICRVLDCTADYILGLSDDGIGIYVRGERYKFYITEDEYAELLPYITTKVVKAGGTIVVNTSVQTLQVGGDVVMRTIGLADFLPLYHKKKLQAIAKEVSDQDALAMLEALGK